VYVVLFRATQFRVGPAEVAMEKCWSMLVAAGDGGVNSPNLPQEVCPLANVLAGCIVDAPELQAGVGSLFENQQDRSRAERWVDLRCAVIETIISRCHRKQKEGNFVHVGEIAQDAAAILRGRGEAVELEPRAIGATLRGLELVAKRNSRGYGFTLTESFSRGIRKLACQFDVATVQEGRTMCGQCSENPLGDGKSEGLDRR
jgi:hypothetical protein